MDRYETGSAGNTGPQVLDKGCQSIAAHCQVAVSGSLDQSNLKQLDISIFKLLADSLNIMPVTMLLGVALKLLSVLFVQNQNIFHLQGHVLLFCLNDDWNNNFSTFFLTIHRQYVSFSTFAA